jgi:aminoglycoside phosphotransferase (APT) family kinase protein
VTCSSLGEAEAAGVLGPDLFALTRGRGVPLAKIEAITTLPSPVRKRGAFALHFADGTRLKGRRFETSARADAVARLRDVLGAGFARLLARRGDAMLLEWVDGPSVASLAPVPPSLLRRCGQALGAFHALPPEALPEAPALGVDGLSEKLEREAALLRGAGLLDAALARRALADAEAHRPGEASVGAIHKDFCPENLVLAPGGDPVCVDEATLAVGPHDLDLARTWYRWPMRREERACFAQGYREHRSPASFERHFRFWATCVLIGSAAIRHRARTERVREPLERLGRLHG